MGRAGEGNGQTDSKALERGALYRFAAKFPVLDMSSSVVGGLLNPYAKRFRPAFAEAASRRQV